jgi:hypothetical protein
MIKLFTNVYDFLNKVSAKAKNLNSEDEWENLINLNNPTYFAQKFREYIKYSLN